MRRRERVSLNRAFAEGRTSILINPVISRQTCFPNLNIRLSAQLLDLGSILYPSEIKQHMFKKGLSIHAESFSSTRPKNEQAKEMLWVRFLNDDFQTSFFILFSSFWLFFFCITTSLVEVGAWDVQGLLPMAQSAPRQSYAPMAGKPAPSCHEPSRQWNQAPVTRIYRGRIKGERDGVKRMIQRLNEESGRQENDVLSTWR